jgi:prepilin-type N-terminal cleavage/methylation domain-containing protein
MNVRIRSRTAGVTLLELLIVISIIAVITSISFPAITAGLAGVRLSSAAGTVASFLTSSMNTVERHELAAEIVISPKENTLAVFTVASGEKPQSKLEMPRGIAIEGDEPRRFPLYPGGTFPGIAVVLRNEKGARRSIRIDPVTAIPRIERVERAGQ